MSIELLESRQMMSVSAHQIGGTLIVRGTAGDDKAIISYFDNEGVKTAIVFNAKLEDDTLVPDLPTDANGEPIMPTIYTGVNLLLVDMLAGNDQLLLLASTGNSIVTTGAGADSVDLNTGGDANVAIDMGAQDDLLIITAGDSSKVLASGAAGADTAFVNIFGDAKVIYLAGAGDDTTTVYNAGDSMNQFVYSGGPGNNDLITLPV